MIKHKQTQLTQSVQINHTQAETKVCLKSLEKYIRSTYGDSVIKISSNNPNKDNQTLVQKSCFKDITDNKFNELLTNTTVSNEYISLDTIATFLRTEANTANTRGKYHELMNMINAMYKLDIINDMPNYDILDEKIKIGIFPKRVEYLICWWILRKIANDKFIGRYRFYDGKKLTQPEFQKLISDDDDRFYDIVFELLDIIVEIQEDNSAHANNPNDLLKEALVKMRSKRILYFKIADFNSKNYVYLDEFWSNDLKPALIQGLLDTNSEIRQSYCIYKFKTNTYSEYIKKKNDLNKINKLIDELEQSEQFAQSKSAQPAQTNRLIKRKTTISNRLKFLEPFFKSNGDKSLIIKLFDWKEKALKLSNEYVIPITDINTLLDTYTVDELQTHIEENYDFQIIDSELFIKWDVLVRLLIMDQNIAIADKSRVLEYLTSIQNIYEHIITQIKIHNDHKLKSTKEMHILMENHLILKQKAKYQPEIDKLNDKYSKADKELGILYKKISTQNNKIKKLCDLITNKATNKKEKELLNQIKSEIADLENLYNLNIGKYISFQKIPNKSIIKEIPEFPIFYTANPRDHLTITDFEAICSVYHISKTNIKLLYKSLLPPFTEGKPNIICMIKDITDTSPNYDISDQIDDDFDIDALLDNESLTDEEIMTEQIEVETFSDTEKQIKKSAVLSDCDISSDDEIFNIGQISKSTKPIQSKSTKPIQTKSTNIDNDWDL